MEVYVDDALITTWASSGTTTDLEAVDFDVVGETVELRGVLDNSEWLSILEVGPNMGMSAVASDRLHPHDLLRSLGLKICPSSIEPPIPPCVLFSFSRGSCPGCFRFIHLGYVRLVTLTGSLENQLQ